MRKRKSSSGDTPPIHPYIAEYISQSTMPIIFWLMTIEDKKIREAAIRNAKLYPIPFIRVDVEFESLSDAIWYAFIWKETPEGHDYWESYYDSLFGN